MQASSGGQLGQVVAEHRPKGMLVAIADRFLFVILFMAVVVGGLAGYSMWTGQIDPGFLAKDWPLVVGIGGFILGTPIVMRLLAGAMRPRFCRHEHGISKSTLFGTRQLRFDEIGSAARDAADVYVNLVYNYSSTDWTFYPRSGLNKSAIKVSLITGNRSADPAIESVFSDVVSEIARGMYFRVLDGERVIWLSKLHRPAVDFLPDGLEIHSEKGTIHTPYSDIENAGSVQRGMYRLFRRGESKPLLETYAWRPDFDAGHLVLGWLLSQRNG